MASTSVSAKYFRLALRQIANNIVWKNMHLASIAEKDIHVDTVYTDKFTSAANKLFEYYSRAQLESVFKYSPARLERFINNAPLQYKSALKTVFEYEEPNNYYRMLAGLPKVGADQKYLIYLSEETIIKYGLTGYQTGVPVHTLPVAKIQKLERLGLLDEYKNLSLHDKNFNYVFYMTDKKIYPFVSRTAERFGLLYCPKSELEALSNDFSDAYEACTKYIIQNFYSEAYKYKYEFYEGFVAMSILFMTLQRMYSKYLEADITRDFYDLDSIRVVYEAYSVPFYTQIPVSYHKRIIKIINALISYKGSDHIFFDLISLFDYGNLEIYEYYLFKEHKMNDGQPIFLYKKDNDGNDTGELDPTAMFDIRFTKRVKGKSIFRSVNDTNNFVDYYGVTNADPYWLNDQALMNKIYEMEYNFIETKYIGLQMTFSMTKFFYESAYFMRLILDNKDDMQNFYISCGKFGSDVDLFTLIIYIHAAICVNLGYSGVFGYTGYKANLTEISQKPAKLARVMGFNFKDDLTTLVDYLVDQELIDPLIDPQYAKLLEVIQNIHITDEKSIETVYRAILQVHELLDRSLITVTDPDVYFAYKNIHKMLLTTELMPEVFTKEDGSHAESYMEMLEDLNLSLALRLQGLEESELDAEIEYCLLSLTRICSDLKYIQMFGTSTTQVITDYLYNLIRFFKSAKAELIDFKIIYLIDGRTNNLLKLMTKFEQITIERQIPEDQLGKEFLDYINYVYDAKLVNTRFLPKDYLLQDEIMTWLMDVVFKAERVIAKQNITPKDPLMMVDFVNKVTQIIIVRDMYTQYAHKFGLSDEFTINTKTDLFDLSFVIDQIELAKSEVKMSDIIKLIDDLYRVISTTKLSNEIIINDFLKGALNLTDLEADMIKLKIKVTAIFKQYPALLWPNLDGTHNLVYDSEGMTVVSTNAIEIGRKTYPVTSSNCNGSCSASSTFSSSTSGCGGACTNTCLGLCIGTSAGTPSGCEASCSSACSATSTMVVSSTL